MLAATYKVYAITCYANIDAYRLAIFHDAK
jgi:hypothetical protein